MGIIMAALLVILGAVYGVDHLWQIWKAKRNQTAGEG